jgi:hypothetical protein
MIQNVAIVCKYHGCTDARGSRISLSLPRWNNKKISFPYAHELNGSDEQGEQELNKLFIFPSCCLDLGKDGTMFGVSFDYMREIERAFKLNGM